MSDDGHLMIETGAEGENNGSGVWVNYVCFI